MTSRPILLAACALGLWLVGLALLPITASAAWLEPSLLSGAGQDAEQPHVAMDQDGDALAVWSRFDGTSKRIQVRPRSAAGTWGPSSTISPVGKVATAPRVALDEDGDALIVWMLLDGANHRIQARTRSAAGVLGPIQNLSVLGLDALEPKVAVDDDGDAIVAWDRWDGTDYRVQARTCSSAGAWTAIATISGPAVFQLNPQLAIDDDGDAIVTWHRWDGARYHVQARSRSSAGAWSGPIPLSAAADHSHSPTVDLDQDGDALVVWQNVDALHGLQFIQSRARSSSGIWGPIRSISGVTAAAPQVALAPDGTATVVWQRDTGSGDRMEGRSRSAGAWGPISVLSDTPHDAVRARVAAGVGGATAVWLVFDGNWRVQSRPWLTSSWRPLTVLSPDDRDGEQAQVAMEEVGGEAIAVWRRFDGTNYRIETSAGP